MTVEVKSEEPQIGDALVQQEEKVVAQDQDQETEETQRPDSLIEQEEKVVAQDQDQETEEVANGDSTTETKEVEDEHEPKLRAVEKSFSFKEESNFLSDLKEIEKKALIELKAKLEEAILGNNLFNKSVQEEAEEVVEDHDDVSLWGVPLLPSKASEVTDVVLLKFLRARDFKPQEAFEMIKKTLQWRKESKINTILGEDLGVDLSRAFYMNGVDREGHPVCYNIFGVFEEEELYKKTFGTEEKREEFLRWRFQLMEKGIKKLDLRPGCVSSLLQINDLKNSPGPSKKELRVAMKQAVSLLQDNYPEFVARNIFINAPLWYYAFNAVLSPFLTQRTKSKFVIARPTKVTETLFKYIPAEEVPVQYGGFKRENDMEFYGEGNVVSELNIKPRSTQTIEIPAPEAGTTLVWDLTVLGWEVSYKEEFVPADEGSYTIIVQKGKKIGSQEGPVRNSFRSNEPGKVVLTIENGSSKKKRVLYRFKTKKGSSC